MKGEETKPGRVQGKFSNAALTHPLTPPKSQPRPGAAGGGGECRAAECGSGLEKNMRLWGSLSDAPSSLFVHQQSVDSQLPLSVKPEGRLSLPLLGTLREEGRGRCWLEMTVGSQLEELRCPPTGTGTDRGEATAATWPYFTAMHEAIGGRPSIDPPTLMDSATAAVASGSGSTSTEAVQIQATVEDEEATESDSDSQEDVEPSTYAGPPPRKKKRKSQFMEAEAAKEDKRFNRQQAATAETSKQFLDLFQELVRK
ncbi:hypothetical protein F7725_021509 [Dissostichus mawsoni]|uniref:Uncharacterized protein n=1 Tax=Dissostichus mawsoni TaxID=36200 RepID=A0A7J5ZC05_DISMA|nr:hypothetical protein F7725_021509 [Dissostichus mawsoni]